MAAGAATVALLTSCSPEPGGDPSEEARKAAAEAAARAETALRSRAARTSRGLLARYDAVLERHPAEHTRLAPLRSAVARHVEALTTARPSPAPTSSPEAAAAQAPDVPAVPADPAEAVRALVAAERRTGDAHTAALMTAPPELARLLASLAAASAAHVWLLTEGPRS
ncbi:hypothetical protein [Streptomyces sp. NPDC088725]|uniref:hypothetical protein n=1 Tax=Streptomyces sp. NPDC088725 TaxID=3365873 RepID=UPI00380D9F94